MLIVSRPSGVRKDMGSTSVWAQSFSLALARVMRIFSYSLSGLEIAACQWPNGRPNFRFGRRK